MKRITDITELCIGDLVIIEASNSDCRQRYIVVDVRGESRALIHADAKNTYSYFTMIVDNACLQNHVVHLDRTSLFNKEIREILG